MAHAFYNYAIVVRIVSALWGNLDPGLEETAKVLGAGRWRAFYHATLPMLLPAVASAALLAFAFSFTSFERGDGAGRASVRDPGSGDL